MLKRNRFVVWFGSVALFVLAGCTPKPATVSVEPGQGRLSAAGETLILRAVIQDAAGKELVGPRVDWASSAPEVATVDTGVVTAVKSGTATITATSEGVSGTAEIAVAIASSIEVMPTELSVAVGASAPIGAMVRDENSQPLEGAVAAFESSDPAVAAVDAGGVVTGVSAGTVTVTVKAGTAAASVAVTVSAE